MIHPNSKAYNERGPNVLNSETIYPVVTHTVQFSFPMPLMYIVWAFDCGRRLAWVATVGPNSHHLIKEPPRNLSQVF